MITNIKKQYRHKLVNLQELIPNQRNARTHSERQIDQIVAVISEFGFTNPLLINPASGIIAGHGRYEAAMRLGYEEVPCIEVDGLTEAQQRALMLADNRIALNAGWDNTLLSQELTALSVGGFDLEALGFTKAEITDMVPIGHGEKDPESTPTMPADPVTRHGDLYIMGDHRVFCGDSTIDESYAAVMQDGEPVDCVWTDPPYNVNYCPKAAFLNKRNKGNRIKDKILNDNLSENKFREFLKNFYTQTAKRMRLVAPIYVAHAETTRDVFTSEFLRAGMKLSGVVVWKKNQLVMGRSDYQWVHEPILCGWKDGGKHKWYGGRKRTTVAAIMHGSSLQPINDGRFLVVTEDRAFTIDGSAIAESVPISIIPEKKPIISKDHPTMKPVALIEKMLVNSTQRGDVVLDPFGGSGSTLIACERLGLKARLIELSTAYCDVIVRRWEEFTGRKAGIKNTFE